MKYSNKQFLAVFFIILVACTKKDIIQNPRWTQPLIKDFIGVNVYADLDYKSFSSAINYVRNYHPLRFDISQIGDSSFFNNGPVENWAQTTYSLWRRSGLNIQVSVELKDFPPNQNWKDSTWLINYGQALGGLTDPISGEPLLSVVEIGNEPGSTFNNELYLYICKYIAQGIRSKSNKISISTCNVHTYAQDLYAKNINDLISISSPSLFDEISFHQYAFKKSIWGTNVLKRMHPESSKTEFLSSLDELIYWRNLYAPDVPIKITEFGWDSPSDSSYQNFISTNPGYQGVTDLQQAQYLVRSILCFSKRQVERVYVYYYKDGDVPDIHSASGLYRNNTPKISFFALKQLNDLLGQYKFYQVIEESKDLFIYEYRHHLNTSKFIRCYWSPTSGVNDREIKVVFEGQNPKVYRMTERTESYNPISFIPKQYGNKSNLLVLPISESPIYLSYEQY